MDLRRKNIGKPVQPERGLMREHTLTLGPQPDDDEVLVLSRWKVNQPVNPASDSSNAPSFDVLEEQLRRVASLRRLLCREVTVLRARLLVKAVPIRAGGHAQKVTVGLVLCKFASRTDINPRFSFVRVQPLPHGCHTNRN